MKTKLTLSLLSVAILSGFASVSHAQSKSQAGGLPELANEVAALRTLVQDLQAQVGGSGNPYAGTYTVTMVETGLFGCGTTPPPGAVGPTLPPYLARQATSSVSVRSAKFEVESTGSTLVIPAFDVFTQELRLSGIFETSDYVEDAGGIPIGSDGSMEADLDDALFSGQFSADGSMFTALVIGDSGNGGGEACNDVWTTHITGVKQ